MKELISRVRLLSDSAVLICLGLADLFLHISVAGRYGYFRDELYYIVLGQRLDFGFVDVPPFTPLMARLSRLLFGDSLIGLRVFPALAGAATVILAGLIARRLGGGRRAQALAAVSVLFSGVILNFGYLLTNNAFDILSWTLAAYLLVLILKENRVKLWPAFGVVAGLALQNKYSIVFFVAALAAGFLLTRARTQFLNGRLWAGLAIALAIFLPNLIWQVRHGLPFIELSRNAVAHKNALLSPLQFLRGQMLETVPYIFLLVIIGALAFLFWRELRPVRAFGWAFLALEAFFMLSVGKTYYMAAIYPVMLAGAAVALEHWTSKRVRWLVPISILLVVLTASVIVPFAIPVMPLERFVAFSQRANVTPQAGERLEMGLLPQHYADQFGWKELAETVAGIYQGLSETDRAVCGIFAHNYGEASAINILGRPYGLPFALSGHNQYWLWKPAPGRGDIMIVIGGKAEDHRQSFREVVEMARTSNKYAMPYENDRPIYLCRGLKVGLGDIWPHLKNFI